MFKRNTSYPEAKQSPDLIDRDLEQKTPFVKQEEAASGLPCYLDTQSVGMVYGVGWNSPEDTEGVIRRAHSAIIYYQSWLDGEVAGKMTGSWLMWHHPQEGLEGGSRELQVYQPDFGALKDYGTDYLE